MKPEQKSMLKSNKEIFSVLIPSLGLLAISLLGFSHTQKDWIHRRDKTCRFPVKHTNKGYTPCESERNLQVHHLIPQRWAREVMDMEDKEIDSEENGILICRNHHQDVIHGTDMPLAHANYHKNKSSYKEAFEERERKVKEKRTYWNSDYDPLLKRIVKAQNKTVNVNTYPKK